MIWRSRWEETARIYALFDYRRRPNGMPRTPARAPVVVSALVKSLIVGDENGLVCSHKSIAIGVPIRFDMLRESRTPSATLRPESSGRRRFKLFPCRKAKLPPCGQFINEFLCALRQFLPGGSENCRLIAQLIEVVFVIPAEKDPATRGRPNPHSDTNGENWLMVAVTAIRDIDCACTDGDLAFRYKVRQGLWGLGRNVPGQRGVAETLTERISSNIHIIESAEDKNLGTGRFVC